MRDSLRLVAAPVAGWARRSGPDDVVEEVLDGGDDLVQDGGGQGQRARQDYCCGCGTHTTIDQHSKLCPHCYMRWPYQPVMGAAPDRCEHCGRAAGPGGAGGTAASAAATTPALILPRCGPAGKCRVTALVIYPITCAKIAGWPGVRVLTGEFSRGRAV